MVFKILKSNYEAMTDNYNISLSFTYGRSVVFFANKTDHQEITNSVNNHKTNTFLQEYRVYIVFPCISSIHFNEIINSFKCITCAHAICLYFVNRK